MDLLNNIPAPIWGLAAIAFAFWMVFMRGKGKKRGTRRTLSSLRRQDEASRRELSIAKNREKIDQMEDKVKERARERAKKKREDFLKW